jgi:hypothetical protein
MANPSSSSIGNATEQQFLPSISIDGYGNLGTYDKWSGGDVTATITKYRPGGMGPEITYPSLSIIGDVTVSRVFVTERDAALVAALQPQAGLVYGTITLQPLDATGNALGNPTTYRGRLAAVKPGNTDSTSSAPRMYDLMFAIETVN